MRAYSYLGLGLIVAACGGSAFSSAKDDGEPNGNGGTAGAEAGAQNRAGREPTGGKPSGGSGGAQGGVTSGGAHVAGSVGIAGEPVVGGAPGAGGEPGAGGQGSDPDPDDKACPTAQPKAGGACTDGLSCSYGSDVRPSCRARAKCYDGKWNIADPACPALAACDKVILGNVCDAGAADCVLANEIFCTCAATCTGSPSCANEQPRWACAAGPGGECPKLPPNEGQACAGSAECLYGACAVHEGVTTTCNGSTWGWESLICPK